MNFQERLDAAERQYELLAVDVEAVHSRLNDSGDSVTVTFSAREAQEVIRALGQHLSHLGTLLSMGATVLSDDDPMEYIEVRDSFCIIDDAFSATSALVSAAAVIPDEVPSWL